MFLEIFVFKSQVEAQQLKDYHGATANLYECSSGAEVIGRAGLGFSGYTDMPVWVVIVET